jgi:hypothetical protein
LDGVASQNISQIRDVGVLVLGDLLEAGTDPGGESCVLKILVTKLHEALFVKCVFEVFERKSKIENVVIWIKGVNIVKIFSEMVNKYLPVGAARLAGAAVARVAKEMLVTKAAINFMTVRQDFFP